MGIDVTKTKDILNVQKKFYSNLYSDHQPNNNIDNYLDKLNVPSLNEEEKESCEGVLTLPEISNSVKMMKNEKAPGSDGIPVEFYKMFWVHVGPLVLNALNEAYAKGEMSISQKLGLISLLPKKDKDPLFLNNWRPLSLFNT